MTPSQIITEILQDYKYNLRMGMTPKQSLEVLRAMLSDMIESEKQQAYDMGLESGAYSVIADLQILGIDEVMKRYGEL